MRAFIEVAAWGGEDQERERGRTRSWSCHPEEGPGCAIVIRKLFMPQPLRGVNRIFSQNRCPAYDGCGAGPSTRIASGLLAGGGEGSSSQSEISICSSGDQVRSSNKRPPILAKD